MNKNQMPSTKWIKFRFFAHFTESLILNVISQNEIFVAKRIKFRLIIDLAMAMTMIAMMKAVDTLVHAFEQNAI